MQNVEITNPMYAGDEIEEEPNPSSALSPSFSIELEDKVSSWDVISSPLPR